MTCWTYRPASLCGLASGSMRWTRVAACPMTGTRLMGRDLRHGKITRPISGRFFDNGPPGSLDVLTNAPAARLLCFSFPTMRRLQRGRRVPFFKVGRCVRYSRLDLETYLSKHRIEAVI